MNTNWGILPEDVKLILQKREWDNSRNRKDLLIGKRPLPIQVGLKPPTNKQVINDSNHFFYWQKIWHAYPEDSVTWKKKKFMTLGEQLIPLRFNLATREALFDFLGPVAQKQANDWATIMRPILQWDKSLYATLVENIALLERLSLDNLSMFMKILEQLKKSMGNGLYLRALPLKGVHSKLIESHYTLLEAIFNHRYQGEVSKFGGLLYWLGCIPKPTAWLLIKPLCSITQQAMGNVSLCRLDTNTLTQLNFPAKHILVVENEVSGLALPKLDNTIAIIGGGKNVSWMSNPILKNKHIAYWGDIDAAGLSILSYARSKIPQLESIMMDEHTLDKHASRCVPDSSEDHQAIKSLTPMEHVLYQRITEKKPKIRLEQELLDSDYIDNTLKSWRNSCG